jgi:nucleoside-diphosphate-sugar epimerase
MIVAITGGTGFIGKELAFRHVQLGDQVRILSRKSPQKNKSVSYFYGDLSNPRINLSSFIQNVDILYHCAGEINNKHLMYELHVNGTRRLVDCAQGKINRWVQLGSVGSYGYQRNGIISEDTEERPLNIYEETKTLSDNVVRESNIPHVILRPSNIFGDAMTNQSLFQLIEMINKGMFFYIGKKGASMNYVHVEDVVEAMFLCGKNDLALGNTYNLSQNIKIEKMVLSILEGLAQKRNFLRVPEMPLRFLTNILSFSPHFPLSISRIDALTSRSIYISNKITNELNLEFKSTLEESFKLIAKKR